MDSLNGPQDILSAVSPHEVPDGTAPPSISLDRDNALRVLERITDSFFALDRDWRFTYLNDQAEALLQRPRAGLLGRSIWDEFPAAVGTAFEREYRRALQEQTAATFEEYYPPPLDTWFEVRVYPSPNGLSVFFHDVTGQVERRQRERFLADLAERARRLIDPDEIIADALRSVGRFLGVSRCVFVDIDIEADLCTAQPDYRADDSVVSMSGTFPISAFGDIVVAAYAAGQAVAVDDVHLDRRQVPAESVASYDAVGIRAHASVPVVHSDRLVSCIGAHSAVPRHWKPEEVALLQTVVERTWLTVEVTRQEHALVREAEVRREAYERTARILENITDAFFTVDREWRYTYINRHVEALWGRMREELLGMTVWEAWPEAIGTAFDRQFHRALDEGIAVSFEEFFPPLDAWLEVRATPSPDGLSVFFQNVSERKRAEAALRESEERYRLLVEGAKDYAMILMDSQGRITSWNIGAERILGWTEAEVLGRPADFIFTPEDCAAGAPAQELRRAAAEGRALDLRWHVKKDGSRFYADGILEELRDDNNLLRGFAQVMRDETERKALEDERERLFDANRLLLESTGEGIYGIDLAGRFTFVNQAAARMLGFTQTQIIGQNGHALIHHTRPDGSVYPENECPIYSALRSGKIVRVESDVFWCADGAAFAVSYNAAPILEHGTVRGAVVTFSDISERKALGEERERIAQRERNIAQQLQAALTPEIPRRIAGLALTHYYKAALEEAGVGGDFYDVFPIEKGCAALVIGDLSGKGLAAATQVATVRNMLRFALYRARTLKGAIESLNSLLAEQGILTGFATLFLGAYDSGAGTLTYVNCGQEPALIRRASGTVDYLPPTGPVLGSFENAVFEEQMVALSAGDALAIFTDGLTEVGKSRREMLGVEGVAAFLEKPVLEKPVLEKPDVEPSAISAETGSAASAAEHLAQSLITRVDMAAQDGVMRDDVCLLVAVVEGGV